jgi:hypothetical protein
MQHHVGAPQGALDSKGVPDISNDELCFLVEISRAVTLRAVNLGGEVVKYPDFVASRQQGIRRMGANEAGASRNQYSCHQWLSLLGIRTVLQPFNGENGKHALRSLRSVAARYSQL